MRVILKHTLSVTIVPALPEGEPFVGEKPLLVGEVDAKQTERLCLIKGVENIEKMEIYIALNCRNDI